jgi:transcriptional regulator with XRE-family HTH domain
MSQDNLESKSKRLAYLIKISGLTQKDFAGRIGKTHRILSMWLSEKVQLSQSNINLIRNHFEEMGIGCDKEWFETGMGEKPTVSEKFNRAKTNYFEHFNIDYSLRSVLIFYQRIYENLIYLTVQDRVYAPRIIPTTLLIASSVPQESYTETWPYGYLHKLNEEQIIPVDIIKRGKTLIALPFEQKGYTQNEIEISSKERLFPIVNIRPLY